MIVEHHLYLSHNESRYKVPDPKYPPDEEPGDGDDDFEYE